MYQRHAKKLKNFHTACLRFQTLRSLARASLRSSCTVLMQSQLRWAGHVACMLDPKTVLRRARSRRALSQRPKETLHRHAKRSLKIFGINPDTWEQTAEDRTKWSSSIHEGSTMGEANRTAAAKQRRQARKARVSDPLPDLPVSPCLVLAENLPNTDWPRHPSALPQTDPAPTTLG